MKIGIITFHKAENFGAVLQCFALQTFLQSLNFDVKIIDYQSPHIRKVYQIVDFSIFKSEYSSWKKIRMFLGRLRTCIARIEKKKAYTSFRNRFLKLSTHVNNVNELPSDINAFVVGSDQMWNIALTGGIDDVYFLNKKLEAIKISYAVSSEIWAYKRLEDESKKIATLINDFSFLSVREEHFKRELQKYTPHQIQVCIDPSFLLNRDEYKKILKKPQYKKYVLAYHLVDSSVMTNIAEQVSCECNKDLIEIHAGFAKYNDKKRHKSNLGPTELLGYIANADIVFTTSFHGLAFSIIFEKQFWVIDNGGNTRQKNLLIQLGLSDRLVKSIEEIRYNQPIDYSEINKRLKPLVDYSIDYLKKSLSRK